MKACKPWVSTGACICALCHESYPASTKGVLCDIAAPIEQTTIVKFVCSNCAGPIATAVVGPELARRAADAGVVR